MLDLRQIERNIDQVSAHRDIATGGHTALAVPPTRNSVSIRDIALAHSTLTLPPHGYPLTLKVRPETR